MPTFSRRWAHSKLVRCASSRSAISTRTLARAACTAKARARVDLPVPPFCPTNETTSPMALCLHLARQLPRSLAHHILFPLLPCLVHHQQTESTDHLHQCGR